MQTPGGEARVTHSAPARTRHIPAWPCGRLSPAGGHGSLGTDRSPWNAQTPWSWPPTGPVSILVGRASSWAGLQHVGRWPLVPTPGGVHPPARPDASVPAGLCPPRDPQVTGPVVTCSRRPSVFSQSSRCGFSICPENPHEAFTRIRGVCACTHKECTHTGSTHLHTHTRASVSVLQTNRTDEM